jgi:hypothetical protein
MICVYESAISVLFSQLDVTCLNALLPGGREETGQRERHAILRQDLPFVQLMYKASSGRWVNQLRSEIDSVNEVAVHNTT